MKLETSAAWRGWASLAFLLLAVLCFWIGSLDRRLVGIAEAGAVWLFFAAAFFRSRWKLRRKIQTLDYQARAITANLPTPR